MTNYSSKWDSFFNVDFYPTPIDVLDKMQIDCYGKMVLEPSAGKGDIINYLNANGAKKVYFCEINKNFAELCQENARFLNYDFLSLRKEDVSHIELIVMNPPFSTAEKHLLHAWEIAPQGCQIISLFNSETFDYNARTIKSLVNQYGFEEYLGKVFSNAERTTDVKVCLLTLFKPVETDNINFEGFYMEEEPECQNKEGLVSHCDVKAVVNSYLSALKLFDSFELINNQMKQSCSIVGMNEGFQYKISYDKAVTNRDDFAKALQRKSWKYIFQKMNIDKYVTEGVKRDLNKFVERQEKIPFTVKNIYKMFDIIFGTRKGNLEKALVETIDKFTQHTHENRYGVEGWKTNAGHLLNKKFIVDWMFEPKYNSTRLRLKYSSNGGYLDDLLKVICNLKGLDYEKQVKLYQVVGDSGIMPNCWYQWGNFFEFKGFKKGTIHIKFFDMKLWEQLNREYARIKGCSLPEVI